MEEEVVKSLETYINNFLEKVIVNAQQCMQDVDENWKTITAYTADETPELQSKYGLVFVIFCS